MAELETITVPGPSIGTHAWWPALHSIIIASFKHKDIEAFPPSWLRLNEDPTIGAKGLADELGPKGEFVILFQDGEPVAASGFLPSRGADWINTVNQPSGEAELTNGEITEKLAGLHPQGEANSDGMIEDWELCCFCINPSHRSQGLSRHLLEILTKHIRGQGGRRLIVNYSVEETGTFWPKMGFTQQVGKGSVLSKGFTHTPGMEGLRADLHFKMSAIVL